MDRHLFSTRPLRPAHQHEAWCEWFRPLFDVTCTDPRPIGFQAENIAWALPGLAVSRVSAPAARSIRTTAHVRRNPVDHWVITLCHQGHSHMATPRGELDAPPGVPFLWSLGTPSDCRRSKVDRIQLFLSRDTFTDIAPIMDAAAGSLLDTPLGSLLGDFMTSLEQRLPSLTETDSPRLTTAIRSLVAACVVPSADRLEAAQRQIDLSRLEKVRQAVRRNLRSPRLGPDMLCREVGMSRSNLYRLMESKGGIARFIQRSRLLDAHATFADPSNTRPISHISEDLCFADTSTFSRAFRKEFGYTPRDAVAAAQSGLTLSGIVQHAQASVERFSDILPDY